jgi:hypothetical protein
MITIANYLDVSIGAVCILVQLFISFCFLYVPTLRKYPNSLLFWNCITDLILQIYLLLYHQILPQTKRSIVGTCRPHPACTAGCFLYVFFSIASLGWKFVIGVDLYLMLKNPFTKRKPVIKACYHLGVWITSITMALISILADPTQIRYIAEKNTCFIADQSNLIRLTVILPMFVFIFFNIILSVYVLKVLKDFRQGLISENSWLSRMDIVIRFTLYTVFTTFFSIIPLVNQMIPIFLPEKHYKMLAGPRNWLFLFSNICQDIRRVIEALIYAANLAILDFIRICFKYRGDREKVLKALHNNELESEGTELQSYNLSKSKKNKGIALGSGIDITLRRDIIVGLMYCMNQILQPWSEKVWEMPLESTHYRKVERLLIPEPSQEDSGNNYSYLFADRPIKFYVYTPEVFKQLRIKFCGGDNAFVKSFPYPLPEDAFSDQFSEGKSGSFFSKTVDEKYIVKSISEAEAKALLKILPRYYDYMNEQSESFLSQIYGLYAIKLYQGFKMTFIVMSNLFPPAKKVPIHSRFDIKGSWVNRSNFLQKSTKELPNTGKNIESDQISLRQQDALRSHLENIRIVSDDYIEEEEDTGPSQLGLDMDVLETFNIGEKNGEFVKKQLKEDSAFLASCGIMDYSLLIGIHKNSKMIEKKGERESIYGCIGFWSSLGHEIYFIGIIDILQMYNSSKKLEKIWKEKVLGKDKYGISVQPPNFYCTRFQEKIDTVFF